MTLSGQLKNMTAFFERVEARATSANTLLCIGIDPHPNRPEGKSAAAAKAFALNLIEKTAEYALMYKPNSAFFERFGADGIAALMEVIEAVPSDIPVLLDAKRGDISSTAAAYADSAFNTLGADAITLSPYLGSDSVAPFVGDAAKGAFVLCKTSNPSSGDIQDIALDEVGTPLYVHMAHMISHWSEHDNVGLVVGATYPKALGYVRDVAPGLWILAPGVGAQGGDLKETLEAGLRPDGLGVLITVSRAIGNADDPAAAALALRDEINEVRASIEPGVVVEHMHGPRVSLAEIAEALVDSECVRFGNFTLKSGIQSPIYIDMRRLVSFPQHLETVAIALDDLLMECDFDRIAALPYAALPIGTAVSLVGDHPMVYIRKEQKTYGTKAPIEGLYEEGETIVILDDLITKGDSKFESIKKFTDLGLEVTDVVVLVDREMGAPEKLAEQGFTLRSAAKITELLPLWLAMGAIDEAQYEEVLAFLQG